MNSTSEQKKRIEHAREVMKTYVDDYNKSVDSADEHDRRFHEFLCHFFLAHETLRESLKVHYLDCQFFIENVHRSEKSESLTDVLNAVLSTMSDEIFAYKRCLRKVRRYADLYARRSPKR